MTNTEERTETNTLDTLEASLRRAKALVGILEAGNATGAEFEGVHVNETLGLVKEFLSDALAAKDHLDGFRTARAGTS